MAQQVKKFRWLHRTRGKQYLPKSFGTAGQQTVKYSGVVGGGRAQRPVSQEVLALTADTDPIIGLGGDGGPIHSKASPLPFPVLPRGLAPGAGVGAPWPMIC